MSFMKAIRDYEYIMTVHMTDVLTTGLFNVFFFKFVILDLLLVQLIHNFQLKRAKWTCVKIAHFFPPSCSIGRNFYIQVFRQEISRSHRGKSATYLIPEYHHCRLQNYSPCEGMHRSQRLVHPSKQFWNWFCGMAFRAAVVLHLMSSMSSKCLPFNISFIFGNRRNHLGLGPVNRQGVPTQLFVYQLKTLLCFCSSVSSFGTIFAHTFLMSRSSVK